MCLVDPSFLLGAGRLMVKKSGFMIWFTGISGPGKRTLANLVSTNSGSWGFRVEWLSLAFGENHFTKEHGQQFTEFCGSSDYVNGRITTNLTLVTIPGTEIISTY